MGDASEWILTLVRIVENWECSLTAVLVEIEHGTLPNFLERRKPIVKCCPFPLFSLKRCIIYRLCLLFVMEYLEFVAKERYSKLDSGQTINQ